jgi:sigma-B regulation protein RsbU (phosphoserine phosphatase)
MMRTLNDEHLAPADLIARLNVQVCRQAPGSRFITLFYAVFDTHTGELAYVNAGHTPPLLLRNAGDVERLHQGGIALGMFDQSTYAEGRALLGPGDLLAIYSDGITEAENPDGRPFDERGLEDVLTAERRNNIAAIGSAVAKAVEVYTADTRLADDLTLLLLRCSTMPAPAGV